MSAVTEQLSAILWNITHRPRLVDVVDILLLTFIIYTLLNHEGTPDTVIFASIFAYYIFLVPHLSGTVLRHCLL